jgi:phenylalanyl-tRNA synthetase beta chain
MNISFDWLKNLIDIDLTAEQTAAELTRVGLAVEGIHEQRDDFVLDIDLTSNRPDCLSHIGVARELGVSTGKPLKFVDAPPEVPVPAVLAESRAKIEDPDLCYRFTARIIRGVKIGPSPEWLVKRLEAVGERSINNVADITNYVMLELGQPMHAFDLDELCENRVVVRRARAGETITTLDEVERKLDESTLMICDAEKPVAIGGVMGGLDSSITEGTVNVLLEVAYFDRPSIRQTSRRLGLATEASYRFERGVDIQNLLRASNRAARMITDLAGGTLGELVDVYPEPIEQARVSSPDISAAVKRLTGLDVDKAECLRILGALGIEAENEHTTFVSPSWRHDIAIEEDLVEEVARHTGYEKIGEELPPAFGAGEFQPNEPRKARLRLTLVDMGYDEAIGYSFIDTAADTIYGAPPGLVSSAAGEPFVTLQTSVIEGAVRMRATLLPGLLDAIRTNINHQRRNVCLFEIGKAFASSETEAALPRERELFSIVITGSEVMEGRALAGRELDFYDAKGALEAALAAAGISDVEFAPGSAPHFREGQTAVVLCNGREVGYLGRIADRILAQLKIKQPVFAAEVDLETLLSINVSAPVYTPLPRFPSVVRDVSFIVGRDASFDAIRDAVIDQGAELCRRIDFADVYEGPGLEVGERSITIRLEYRSDERTLLEEDVDAVHSSIVNAVASAVGARLRQ